MKAKIQHEIQEYCSLLRLNAISEHFEEAIKTASSYCTCGCNAAGANLGPK